MQSVDRRPLLLRSALPDQLHLLPELQFTDTGQLVGRVPVLLRLDDQTVLTDWNRLPVASGSLDRIDIGHLPEIVQEDTLLLEEIARVLQNGGVARMSLANSQALMPFEGVNTYRYFRDIVHRGKRPLETLESGWRRTYSREDIGDLMRLSGFDIVSIRAVGLGLDRLTTLASLVETRWLGRIPADSGRRASFSTQIHRLDGNFADDRRGSVWEILVRKR